MADRKDVIIIFVLVLLGLLTRALFFFYPPSAVFDEVYIGNFVLDYVSGNYFFDLHPPLGKLLAALFGSIFGLLDPVDFSSIGDALPLSFVSLRLLLVAFGALLPAIVFSLARLLRLSVFASASAGFLVVFENSLVVQSRFILFDGMLLLFGFLSLVAYLASARYAAQGNRRAFWLFFCLAAFFSVSAVSIKWTGLSFVLLIALMEVLRVYSEGWSRKEFLKIATFGGIFVTSYFLFFAVHLQLLPKSGAGDAFMSPSFQKSLSGSVYESRTDLPDMSLLQKITELNEVMLRVNLTFEQTHHYGSLWYTWLLLKRPIYYWEGVENQKIYFLGNPIVYWFGGAAVLALFVLVIRSLILRQNRERLRSALFIVGGYLLNFLPFAFIGRVMFLYHYLAALVFGILALAFLADGEQRIIGRFPFGVLLFAALLSFLYFSPLTYGVESFYGSLEERFWFESWR